MKKRKLESPKSQQKNENDFGVGANNSETLMALAKRIRRCAELSGSGDALAQKAAIPRRTLETYLTGDAEPKTLRLVAIAHAADVDLKWLATGEGEMRQMGLSEPASPAYQPVAPLDQAVLRDVIQVVEEFLQERGLRLEPEKKAELLVLIYEDIREHEGKVDRARIIKLVNLAA